MAINHVIRTARLTDSQVLELMFELNDELKIVTAKVNIGFNPIMSFQLLARDDESLKKLYGDRYCILETQATTATGLIIIFLRGICANYENFRQHRTASPYYDEIVVAGQINDEIDEFLSCMDIIQNSLPRIYPLQTDDQAQSAADILQREIISLTKEYRKVITGLEAERASFHKTFEESHQKLNTEREESRKMLEAERRKLNAEHQAEIKKFEHEKIQRKQELLDYEANKKSEFQIKKEKLDKREKGLDDRHYMHTRRDLRNQITKNYKDRIGKTVVSSRAWRIQWLIFLMTLFAGIVAGYYSIESYQDLLNLDNESNDQWKMVGLSIRSATLTIAAVGLFFYAVNWLKGIYVDHVRTDRKYESYGNDIDRASFVIETIMEVGEKEHAEVPDTWISGVCRNLFTEKGSDSYDTVPSSVATMLLESISGAKIRTDGADIDLKKRDARKLARKLKKTD